jgi:t-SNARE complex subunit (syntaxin)
MNSEIQERKENLNKAKRTASELDSILKDLKQHIDRLKLEE